MSGLTIKLTGERRGGNMGMKDAAKIGRAEVERNELTASLVEQVAKPLRWKFTCVVTGKIDYVETQYMTDAQDEIFRRGWEYDGFLQGMICPDANKP
jgi:hypothetical protein